MHLHICMHNTYTFAHRTHTYMQLSIGTQKHLHTTHTCICTHKPTWACTDTYAHRKHWHTAYTHTQAQTHKMHLHSYTKHAHTYAHMQTHSYMHVYICTHKTYTYTHTEPTYTPHACTQNPQIHTFALQMPKYTCTRIHTALSHMHALFIYTHRSIARSFAPAVELDTFLLFTELPRVVLGPLSTHCQVLPDGWEVLQSLWCRRVGTLDVDDYPNSSSSEPNSPSRLFQICLNLAFLQCTRDGHVEVALTFL